MKHINQKNKFILNTKIKSYYENFKKFVCCDKLPDFKVEYTNSLALPYELRVGIYDNPLTLYWNLARLNKCEFDLKCLLVHEFTHMYDSFCLRKNFEDDFLKNSLHLYTEYHAIQIEFLYRYKIIKNISKPIDSIGKNCVDMWKFWHDKNAIYRNMVSNYLKDKTAMNFHHMKTSYMYTCGASIILSKVTGEPIKFAKFEELYCDQIIRLQQVLQNIDYNRAPTYDELVAISNMDKELDQQFLNSMKYKYGYTTSFSASYGTKRWLTTGLFGLSSSDVGKTMKCKNCGYKW